MIRRPFLGSFAAHAARAVVLVAVALATPPWARAGDVEAKTAHVHARGDVPVEELEAYCALAEAVWPQWKAYFGAEPPRNRMPLELDVRLDREGFLHAVHKVGVLGTLPAAGGYYDPGSRLSFLYRQPHASSTRLLVLHELTHQYQYKALQDDVPDRSPVWHREGLAERFGYHRRMGEKVETGAYDVVAIDDRPSECAKRVAEGTFDPWAVGTGKAAAPDYTDALALVETCLSTKDEAVRDAYRRFEREIYKGGNAASKFERAFDGKRARLEAAAKEVWGRYRRTWRVVYVAWDEKDGVILGRGMPWSFLQHRDVPTGSVTSIEAKIGLGPDAVAGGLAVGARAPEDLIGVVLRREGRVILSVRRRGAWTDLAAYVLPGGPPRQPVPIRLAVRGLELTVDVAGLPAMRVDGAAAGLGFADFSAPAGLFAESGEVTFEDVHVGER